MLWLAAKKEEVFVCLAGGGGGRSETRYLGLRRTAHDSLGQKFWFFSTVFLPTRNWRAQPCKVALVSLWLVPNPPRRGGKSGVTLVAAHCVPAHWASFRRLALVLLFKK